MHASQVERGRVEFNVNARVLSDLECAPAGWATHSAACCPSHQSSTLVHRELVSVAWISRPNCVVSM